MSRPVYTTRLSVTYQYDQTTEEKRMDKNKDTLKFVVVVEGKDGYKYVGSPTYKLVSNPFFCGVIGVDDIDEVFHYWDQKTSGHADIWMYEEFKARTGV